MSGSTEDLGFAHPFRFHNGQVDVSSGVTHIQHNIMRIIGIAKGEIPFRPDFGCDIHRRVFDPINATALADGDIRAAVAKWEPRAEIIEVTGGTGQ
jgi:hypothetical protein